MSEINNKEYNLEIEKLNKSRKLKSENQIFNNFLRFKRVLILNIIEEYRMRDRILIGYFHACIHFSDGHGIFFGKNSHGQCDIPEIKERYVIDIALGFNHTCILLDDGSVRAFGNNDNKQCDIPEYGNRRVIQVACGKNYTSLLLDDGKILIFGDNSSGQCDTPDLGNLRVIQVSLGWNHTCLLLEDGSVRVFGSYKQNSVPDLFGQRVIQAECGTGLTCLLLEDGGVALFGKKQIHQDIDKQKKVPIERSIVKVSCGSSHVLLLQKNGEQICFGCFKYELVRLGHDNPLQISVNQISACGESSGFLALNDYIVIHGLLARNNCDYIKNY